MSGFVAKIFNNSTAAIAAQQALIANAGNNIANVNTEGFARRVLSLETRSESGRAGGITVGAGVQIGSLTRVADEFLSKIARESAGSFYENRSEVEYLDRIEPLFALSGEGLTIGGALSEFFNSINNLSLNPASIELRTEMIERAQDLVTSINQTYQTVARLQSEADQRLGVEINTINAITSKIADLNGLISTRETTGGVAADERDKRALLLDQLAEKISYQIVEASDGQVTISLPNGFPIVSGVNSRALEVTSQPSFAGGALPPSLSGEVLSYVVYDYDMGAGNAHIDLTQFLKQGSGTVGGLLQLRGYADPTNTSAFEADGILVDIASRVEAISQMLLTTFNQTYLGPDTDAGTAGLQPSALDLDGNPPDVFGLFTFAGLVDDDGDGVPDTTDLAASGVANYSSILSLAFNDPRRIAAAQDTTGAAVLVEGDASNLADIAALQSSTLSFQVGSYSRSATFGEVYNELVGRVGNLRNTAEVDLSVAQSNLIIAQNRRDEVQGVSLDEEFTDLIQFQKAYEANARMLKIGREILDVLVGLL